MREDRTVKRVELVAYGPQTQVLRNMETEAMEWSAIMDEADDLMNCTFADTVVGWCDGSLWFVLDWRGVVRRTSFDVGRFVA